VIETEWTVERVYAVNQLLDRMDDAEADAAARGRSR
jgi:hypothetical protein